MRTLRQVNIKKPSKLFFNTMTKLVKYRSSIILKKNTDCVIYYNAYFKNLDSKNSIYLVFNNVDAHIEKNNEDKYLVFALTDKNKEALENYTELWDEEN